MLCIMHFYFAESASFEYLTMRISFLQKLFKFLLSQPRSRPASLGAGDKVFVELERGKRADATQHHDPDEAMWNDTAVQVQND